MNYARVARCLAAVVAVAALATTGCSMASQPSAESAPQPDGTSFPVTIETAYGALTVPAQPERVVALTGQHVDLLDSIGVVPVASPSLALDEYPWLESAELGEQDPALVDAENRVALQAIAAHEPDLILASTWQVDEQLYEQISRIAPTYVGRVEGNNDWNDLLEDVGSLTGASEAAAEAMADVEAVYAEARAELPGLNGLTYSYLGYMEGFFSGNGTWLEGFGLVAADYQDNTQSSGDVISLENVAEIDADVVFIWPYQTSFDDLEQDPRFQELPSAVNDAAFEVDLPLANATNGPGPLSLQYALDRVVAMLQQTAYVTD